MHKIELRNNRDRNTGKGRADRSSKSSSVGRKAVLHRRTPKPNHKPIEAALIGAILLAVAAMASPVCAGINDVPKKVREGIEHYEAHQYDKAAAAFDAARQIKPDDARVLFDAACAKAAAGATDEAVMLFQQAAVTPDPKLAASCHYNLGRLAADRAKNALGAKPDEAEPAARAQSKEAAEAAIAHWRDCLAMEPDDENARYNIEMTSLWLNHMDQVWKEADRKKRIGQMSLSEMLQWLETEQASLRNATRGLEGLEPSPINRLTVHRTADTQRDLCNDIGPLKEKITQTINQPAAAQGATPGMNPNMNPAAAGGTCAMPGGCSTPGSGGIEEMDPEQREHAVKLLSSLADEAGTSMRTAAEYIAEQSPKDARASQAEAIEHVDQIGTVITPYADLVHKAVGRQKELVDQSKRPPGETEPAVGESDKEVSEKTPPASEPDPADAAWRQQFVERWTPIMIAKAKQGLAKMPPGPEAKETKEANEKVPSQDLKPPGIDTTVRPTEDKGATDITKPAMAEPPVQPTEAQSKEPRPLSPEETAKKKQEALRKSMQLAVELGPQVQRLTAQATADLADQKTDAARSKQAEALRLLEKIAEPLKDENQNNQNQEQQNQQDQDQKKNDQNKQDKKNQDKKDQNQQDQDQKKDDKDKNKPDQQKPQGQDQSKPQQPKPDKAKAQPKELSKQQAEALIQQLRQRDREKEKARKALIEATSRPSEVEKDW